MKSRMIEEQDGHEETTPLTDPATSSLQNLSPKGTRIEQGVWVVGRCTLIASLASVIAGMSGGVTSSALLELSNENQTIESQYFDKESFLPSLFGSIEIIGGMIGGLLAWPVSIVLSRRTALIVGGIPSLWGWLLMSYSAQITGSRAVFITALLTARVFTGFGAGWASFFVSLYNIEIASPKLKGFFGNFHISFYTFGSLFSFILAVRFGDFQFSYSNVSVIVVGIVILFQFLMIIATYESPRWLFSMNMNYKAIQNLKIFRGKDYHDVAEEVKEIKGRIKKDLLSVRRQFGAFENRAVYHPFILVMFASFFQQFNGSVAVMYYASQIFSEAGYSDTKSRITALVTVGVVRMVAIVLSTVLVDFVGRRVLLLLSSAGIVLSLTVLGVYFFIFEKKCNNSLSFPGCPDGLEYIAILSVAVYNAANSIGWSPLANAMRVELLPNQIRTLGGSIANVTVFLSSYIVTVSFNPYVTLVTPKFAWWTIALIMVGSIVFVTVFLPEAKGRSLEEIQASFEEGRMLFCAQNCTCCKICSF